MPIKLVADLVAKAKTEIATLPLFEADAAHVDPDTLFVGNRDIRELKRDGRIPGAMHAPCGMLEYWGDPASPNFLLWVTSVPPATEHAFRAYWS